MPVKVVFRCEFCRSDPDAATQATLETQMFGLLHGEYVDAEPGHWLVWRGGGIYGRDLYACAEHRGDLTAHLRRHYGTLGWHPWKRPPYRRYPHREDPERERRIRRLAVGPRWAGRL